MVDDKLVAVTAKRLELAITKGGNPRNARAGVIIIPPPTPISAPKRPAPNPMVINRIIINSNKIHTLIHNIFQSGKHW